MASSAPNVNDLRRLLSGHLDTVGLNQDVSHEMSETLHRKFVVAWQRAPPGTKLQIAFHGTSAENIDPILRDGLDPNRRRRQALGPG